MAVERKRKKLNLTLDPETIDFLAWLDDEHKLGTTSRLVEQAVRSHFQGYLKEFQALNACKIIGDDDHGGQRT